MLGARQQLILRVLRVVSLPTSLELRICQAPMRAHPRLLANRDIVEGYLLCSKELGEQRGKRHDVIKVLPVKQAASERGARFAYLISNCRAERFSNCFALCSVKLFPSISQRANCCLPIDRLARAAS